MNIFTCLEKMYEFKKTGVTIVFVSHSLEDVSRICDRVAWIENHAIKMIGKPTEIIKIYSGMR